MPVFSSGTQIGPYLIIEPMQKGGMAHIYRAHIPDSSLEVALKVSLADNGQVVHKNALRQEVDILKDLDHPGVIRILPTKLDGAKDASYTARELNLPGQPWYYAMEYLPGGSLESVLKKMGKLPLNLAAAIIYRMVSALGYIHSHDVVHLDIKPGNILLRYPLVRSALVDPVLIDFGVANSANASKASGGTLYTMPPEYILSMRGKLDPQTKIDLRKVDIYALGVVFYRLVTGQYPFTGFLGIGLTQAILKKSAQPPSKLDDALFSIDSLIQRWLSKEPAERPSVEELDGILQDLSENMTNLVSDLTLVK